MANLKVAIEKLVNLESETHCEEVIYVYKGNCQLVKDNLKSFITGFEVCCH